MRPFGGGPQSSAELGLEQVGVFQAQAQRPLPQEGILFLWQIPIRQGLVPANVQRTQSHRFSGSPAKNLRISAVLFLLRWHMILFHIEKLRAKQPHKIALGKSILLFG